MTVLFTAYILYSILILVIGEKSLNTIPQQSSNFSCKSRDTGFYADIESNCQIYYTCDDHGNKFSYNCPQDTVFNQETLVCDHTYRVDCQKSAKFILQDVKTQQIQEKDIESDNTQNANKFSRSFRITPQPSIYFLAPKDNNNNNTKSSVLKDQSNSGSNQDFFKSSRNSQFNRGNLFSSVIKSSSQPTLTSSTTTTTTRPQLRRDDTKNFTSKVEKQKIFSSQRSNKINDTEFQQPSRTTTKSSVVIDPYSGTLRSIQNNNKISNSSTKNQNNKKEQFIVTTVPTTTAGTDFPIPSFEESLFSGLTNFNDDDPYYPRYTTSTEGYTLETIEQTPFSFTTQRIRTTNFKLNLVDLLPDLNSVEDLVDRRKHLFIPKTKNI
ncbi:uncharacterized protein LOC123271996 [Cotesia glomerata]|uniref:uncharacterized protein LOC123271996 n=1 Tax=Cotesia glomerata TaxID=32391 RepID=UPI001D016E3E|nr:uncharacterized protein LOC123271996 [Cotesia glomerata]